MKHKPVTLRAFNWTARPALKWEVSWPHSTPGKRRLQRRFESKTSAQAFYAEKLREVTNTGRREAGLPDEWLRDAGWARVQLAPAGVGLREVVADYLRRHSLAARSIALSDAVEEYLEARESNGLAPRSLADARARLRRFVADMPEGCRASDVEKRDVEDWLAGLKLAPQTQRNFQRVIHTLLQWTAGRGYSEGNAAALGRATTKRAKIAARPVQIYTPAELRLILDNCPPPLLPFMVLGAFCGIRTAEIERLDWQDVDFLRGHVAVSPEQSKTAARRFVPLPDAAKEWLAPVAKTSGLLAPKKVTTWLRNKFHRELETAHGLEWKDNGLRHSFASYALALHEDAPRVSLWLGQASPSVVFRHYRERATKQDAQAYFDTAPSGGAKVIQFTNTNAA